MVKGAHNGQQRHECKDNSGKGRPKHPFCPDSHLLLGVQIIYLAALLPLTPLLVFVWYGLANRGFDAMDGGDKWRGTAFLRSGFLLACGTALFLPRGGYWLAFEEGTWRLLC